MSNPEILSVLGHDSSEEEEEEELEESGHSTSRVAV